MPVCGALSILAGLAMGVYSLWVAVRGLMRGEVVDTGRHHNTTYARATAPLGYWLTEAGLLLCGIILVLAFSSALSQKLRPPRTPPSTKE